MKYNYQYVDNRYQRKLRELLNYYAGFIITSDKDLLLEGERLDLPNVAIKGGERMYNESDRTYVVYRVNTEDGTVDEI